MDNEQSTMTLKSIGIVRNELKQASVRRDRWEVVSEIVIDSSLTEALYGLEDFSHIIVIYWTHLAVIDELPLKIHPRGNPKLPLVGRFATRSPSRPNRVAETTVRLLQCKGNILRVEGLDALDGSPVIDIKPYLPGDDSVVDAKVPQWITD